MDGKQKQGLTKILESRTSIVNMALSCAIWFMVTIPTFIMVFFVKHIPIENVYLVVIISAIAVSVARILSGVILSIFSYKIGFILTLSLSMGMAILYCFF